LGKALWITTVLTGFSLFACINDNTPAEPKAATGVARLKLPQLPEGYKDSLPGSGYSLTVTVTGPGMQPLSHAWDLSRSGGKTVSFEDIPAGPSRIFTGVLMRGTAKTHEGKYTLDIGAGESVFVPLVLREVGTGRAEICIEIQGWPGSPDCMPIDTLPVDTPALAGCWYIDADDGTSPLRGTLSLQATASGIYGGFVSDNGQSFMANATFIEGAWCIRIYPLVLRPDTVWIDMVEHEQRPQSLEKASALAQDTVWNQTYLFRIREFSSGPADEPYGMFWGIMLDPNFQNMIGEVRGTAALCLAQPIPVDTQHHPVILPAVYRMPDTLIATPPSFQPD